MTVRTFVIICWRSIGCGIGVLSLVLICAAGAPGAEPPPADATSVAEPDAILNASSLRPVPQGVSVRVQAWDNSEEHIALARHIEEGLRARGRTVAEDAPLVLKFSLSDSLGRAGSGPQRRIVELDGRVGSASENEARVQLNLFSSDKGGVFNQAPAQQRIQSTRSLEMTLDRADGQRLWQGEATAKVDGQERETVARQLVGPLLDNLGKTARSKPLGIK